MSELPAEPAPEPVLEFYCPGCGQRYEMPGICVGSPESGHPALAVASTSDETATTEAAVPQPETVTQAAEPTSPAEPPAEPVAAAEPEKAAEVVDQTARDGLASLGTDVDALAARVAALEHAGQAEVPAAPPAPAPPGGFPS